MKWIRLIVPVLFVTGALADPVDNPLKPTDALTIKVQKLEATPDAQETGKVFISARLLLCIDIDDKESCQAMGDTGGLQIAAGESKDFQKENRKSMVALYTPVIKNVDIDKRLATLPGGHEYSPPFLKIELRKNVVQGDVRSVKVEDGQVVGFITENFPDKTTMPHNEQNVLRKVVEMNAKPGQIPYGAQVDILIQRNQ